MNTSLESLAILIENCVSVSARKKVEAGVKVVFVFWAVVRRDTDRC